MLGELIEAMSALRDDARSRGRDRHRGGAGLLRRRALFRPDAECPPRSAGRSSSRPRNQFRRLFEAGHHAAREPRAGDDRDGQRPRDRRRVRPDPRVRLPLGGGGGDVRDPRGRPPACPSGWRRPRGSSAWWGQRAPRRSSWSAGGTAAEAHGIGPRPPRGPGEQLAAAVREYAEIPRGEAVRARSPRSRPGSMPSPARASPRSTR